METFYVKSNDVNLFTIVIGKQTSDKVIVILHGGPGSGAMPLIDHESFKELEKEFLLVYFDQRGSGKSSYDLNNKLKLQDLTYDVHTIVQYVKGKYSDKKVYLWGGSFGGALGFLYLREYPREVKKYIGACPAIFFSDDGVKKGFKKILCSYKTKVPKSFMLMLNTMPISSDGIRGIFNRKPIKEFIFSEKCNSRSLKHSWAMSDWLFSERFGEDFRKISIPVLITQGKQDEMLDFNNIYNGYREFYNPLISFKEYDNCGHTIFEDRKDCFAEDIKRFFL